MPLVSSFCGCTDILTGGAILGWIAIILRTIFLGICLLLMVMSSALADFAQTISKSDKDYGLTDAEKENLIEFGEIFSVNINIGLGILAFIAFIGLIIAILFVVGVSKRRSSFITPYLVFDVLSLLLWFFNWLGSFDNFQSLIFTAAIFGVMVYLYIFAIAVFQHIKELETRPAPQAYLMQPMVPNPNIYCEQPPPSYPNLYPTKEIV